MIPDGRDDNRCKSVRVGGGLGDQGRESGNRAVGRRRGREGEGGEGGGGQVAESPRRCCRSLSSRPIADNGEPPVPYESTTLR